VCVHATGKAHRTQVRERDLFIGTPFSNLYTLVHLLAIGRIVVCLVFVIACKYVLGYSEVSQPLNLLLIKASFDTLVFSLRLVPSQPATDVPSTRPGSSAASPSTSPPCGTISSTCPPRLESGWEVGVIKAFDKKGLHAGKFSIKYKDDRNWWTHSLLREGYGKDKQWVLLGLPSRDSA
jgi:hypothetical protein